MIQFASMQRSFNTCCHWHCNHTNKLTVFAVQTEWNNEWTSPRSYMLSPASVYLAQIFGSTRASTRVRACFTYFCRLCWCIGICKCVCVCVSASATAAGCHFTLERAQLRKLVKLVSGKWRHCPIFRRRTCVRACMYFISHTNVWHVTALFGCVSLPLSLRSVLFRLDSVFVCMRVHLMCSHWPSEDVQDVILGDWICYV